MVTQTRPRYPATGPGRPPQLPDPDGDGVCIECGARITDYDPARPFCVDCWGQYRGIDGTADSETMATLRQKIFHFCHGCGEEAQNTFGDVRCYTCKGVVCAA